MDDDPAEIPVSKRTRTWDFYVVLVVAVLPLVSVVAGSWLFVLYSLHTGRIWVYGYPGRLFFAAALAEVSHPAFR